MQALDAALDTPQGLDGGAPGTGGVPGSGGAPGTGGAAVLDVHPTDLPIDIPTPNLDVAGTCVGVNPRPCAQTRTGMEITYPRLDATGNPLGNCRLGTQTCTDGVWGECVGAVGPSSEVCDRVDNDCNGVVDDNASDVKTFWYDADGDLHAALWSTSVVACFAPTTAPAGCAAKQSLCPGAAWTATAIHADDCDDNDANRYPGAPEKCNRIDDDCSNTDGSKDEPLEDEDQDGYTDKTYAGCSGGYPRTDCDDNNPDVHPGQTQFFDVGYCLTSAATIWCPTKRQCAHVSTCADSIGQVWGAGSVDYNCDGVEEPFSVSGTDVVPYEAACAEASTAACEGPTTPHYAISANAPCGAVSEHEQCKLNSAGTACEYQSVFLMTACR